MSANNDRVTVETNVEMCIYTTVVSETSMHCILTVIIILFYILGYYYCLLLLTQTLFKRQCALV